ncbi:MAG: hypothetical protein B9S34_13915 [Opitutia bacterium Tous-C1TDCM]|nr:MAG: hypothetical protein B9S34_13915 [Opitutae bacterium Tous-C1TDCM]
MPITAGAKWVQSQSSVTAASAVVTGDSTTPTMPRARMISCSRRSVMPGSSVQNSSRENPICAARSRAPAKTFRKNGFRRASARSVCTHTNARRSGCGRACAPRMCAIRLATRGFGR